MTGIQLLLLTGVSFIGVYFVIRLKKTLLDTFLLVTMAICAIIFVIWPGVTNIIANRLGVGRGADLIFYISNLIFWFVILKLYSKIRRLEQAITVIIRDNALRQATQLPESANQSGNSQ